ncbi:hypothetical protein COV93_01100 [Candidatus Woesearchaeota archaeon CG11_big_fil_rev_8_21_14_0_20_43_8]|nr:MAG: hypothetical protein COV93_01100 [Candidatus Woesearchaeota archaeon CG11_big_fil_rev_8_21_14_0_20_43_8]PIO04991.1 MAG: hypothetical protein COT47_06660 [Candidatus Woesearchaeota archaeon CG08_land_8_20_14_0_20_43_7]
MNLLDSPVYVYYDKKSERITDFLPVDLDDNSKAAIINQWQMDIPRRILKALSENDMMTAPRIKETIGHSMSTLHENIKKLEEAGLIETKMIFEGNKQKIIRPKVFFVTQNPRLRSFLIKAANQGVWVETEKSKSVLKFLKENADEFHTAEEISLKLKIPVDEVKTLLENWNSQFNRGLSEFMKKMPFERRVYYRAVKSKK